MLGGQLSRCYELYMFSARPHKILARRIAPLTHNVWMKSGNETVDGKN